MRRPLRIFISSPGDVQEERLRAHLVVQKLARDYGRFFRIEPYLWEYEPMLASGHFQDAIEPPSQSDIMVLVVYSRLGTALPERTGAREYRGLDGRAPVTGTEWEFEDALVAHRANGAPDLLAYRKLGDPQASLADAAKRAEQERQWDALEAFWRRHFEGGGMFLAGSAKFGTLEEFDAKLEADLVRLIEARIAAGLKEVSGGGEEATWLHGSPFQGLAAYDFHDAPVFFGRDAPIREASTRLQAAAADGTAFLLVLGASGSGKSSLARAGILPALFAAKAVPGVGLWRRVVLRPAEGGLDPVLGLAQALIAGNPQDGEGLPELVAAGMGADALAAHLGAAPDDPSYPFRLALAGIAGEARSRAGLLPHEEARLVVLVDQVEELFTRDIDPERRALFVRILAGLAASRVVWVVATMRNDLWHRAAEIPQLVALTEAGARLDLPAPGGAEMIEIVRRPAAAAGVVFEKDHETGVGLDAVIARAAAEEPGALPLLSVMLQSLYGADIIEAGGRALTFGRYRAIGELKGAIATRADEALAELRTRAPDAAAALPRVLRALVTASGDGTATSRPARLHAFADGGPEARLVAAFLERRLLVASERDGTAEIRLAHEALLENWPAARDQITTDRRDLQTRARLETLQRRWSEAGTPAERKTALLTGLNLLEGADLVRRWEIPRREGLGAYVAQSQAAEGWRRKRFAIAASVLVLVFAGIAALASLQWRRAEQQAVLARAAEETEREQRSAADAARNEALREKDRADAETARALAALRDAKLSAARSLGTQADLAAGRSEIRRALNLALNAADAERDVLPPGEPSASLPALLRALSDDREVLHVDRGKGQGAEVPHAFYGDDALVYADMDAGVMLADLATGQIRRLAAMPEETLPLHVRAAPSLGLVVVTSVKNVFVIDAASATVRAQITFEDRISALDVHEGSRTAAIGTGSGLTLIDLDRPMRGAIVPVPDPTPDHFFGQIRFASDGRSLLASYGVDIYPFDRTQARFGAKLAVDLAGGLGIDREVADRMSAQGIVAMVGMRPDPTRNRLLTFSALHLWSVRPDGTRYEYDRDTLESPLGIDFTGPDSTGDVVAIFGRRADAGTDIRIGYISEEKKPLLIDAFRASVSDLDNEALQGCRVSRNTVFLACGYNGKTSQGVHVWRIMGGKHRSEREAAAFGASASAAVLAGAAPRLLVGTKIGLGVFPAAIPVAGATWNEGWRLGAAVGPFVPARNGRDVQVLRAEPDRPPVVALPPMQGQAVVLRRNSERALVVGADRLTGIDLGSGRTVWAAPGLAGVKAAAIGQDGAEIVAATADAVYGLDGRTGRITGSRPLSDAWADGPFGFDPDGRRLAYAGKTGALLTDVASGRTTALATGPGTVVSALAFAGDRVLVGLGDGRVLAFDGTGRLAWSVPAPEEMLADSYVFPGQRPQGTVLEIAVGSGGSGGPVVPVAIRRQDILPLDIHDPATGQRLTRLTPPWLAGVPASVAFGPDGRIATAWALHVVTVGAPNAVALHRLPFGLEEAATAARAALTRMAPRAPDGSARPAEPASN